MVKIFGYQQMFDHLHSVDLINFDIRKAPFTKDKEELMVMRTISDQNQEMAMLFAYGKKDVLFNVASLVSKFKISPAVAQQSLKDAGFEPYLSRRRWIKGASPIMAWKHKETKEPTQIFYGYDDYISIAEDDPIDDLSVKQIRAIHKENRNIR